MELFYCGAVIVVMIGGMVILATLHFRHRNNKRK